MEKLKDVPGGTRKLYGGEKVDDSVVSLLRDCLVELRSLEDGTGDYTPTKNVPSRAVGKGVGKLIERLKKALIETS